MWLFAILILLLQGLAFLLSLRPARAADPDQRDELNSVFRLVTIAQVLNVGTLMWFARYTRRFGFGISAMLSVIALMSVMIALRLRRQGCARTAALRDRRVVLRKICHETHTPLAAISGYAEMLADGAMGAASRRSLTRKIHRISMRLSSVVRDLLEVTKRDGQLPIQHGPLAVEDLVADEILLNAPLAARRGLELCGEFGARVPLTVHSDVRLLRIAVDHLIRNAIENSTEGRVCLRVDGGTLSSERASIRFTVIDDGVGIAPARLEQLRTPRSAERTLFAADASGFGVGLPMCRRIASALAGQLQLDSTLGDGTTASIEVPSRVADDASTIAAGPFDPDQWLADRDEPDVSGVLAGRRVLLVEDGPENREFIRHFLQRAGAEVDTAVHGRDALEILALGADRFDVVLMDMDMPVMNGYAAAAAARAHGYDLPIIALSAHTLIEDQKRTLEAGCDEFIAKPVSAHNLVAACARHVHGAGVGRRPRALHASGSATDQHLRPVRSRLADQRHLEELLADYHRAMPVILDEIEGAWADQDAECVRTLAHRLKGSGGQYGYDDLRFAAAECERILKEGGTLADADSAYRALLIEIGRVAQNAEPADSPA